MERRPDPFSHIPETNDQKTNATQYESVEEGDERMTRVERRPSETFDSLFRRFRWHVARDRIMSDVKKHRYFIPKCQRRQVARRKAIRRERQRQQRQSRQHRRPYAFVRTKV
jgi:ribosomal protein S21